MNNPNKLYMLAIGAHPDDIELGAGGTLVKHVMKGHSVGILDLTQGELGSRGNAEIRKIEAQESATKMGIKVRVNAGFADGFFVNDAEHKLKLISYIRMFMPEIVIANALEDRHPDHSRAARMVADACFLSGLSKIETDWEGQPQQPWRPKRIFHMIHDKDMKPDIIVDISNTCETKMEAIKSFKSQFFDADSPEPMTYIATESFLHNIAHKDALMGKKIGTAAGEGFVCENILGIPGFDALLLPQIS